MKYKLKTIRAVVILVAVFFMYANNAFAAPMLYPVEAINIKEDSATLTGRVSNNRKNSTVWFEWNTAYSSGAPIIAGRQQVFGENDFNYKLNFLTPGETYSFRAVAMEGGAMVYSATASFKTVTSGGAPIVTTSYQTGQTGVPLGVGSIASGQPAPVPVVTEQVNTNRTIVLPTVTEQNGTDDGFTNNNTNVAAVIGTGDNIFPGTLIGWVLLIIAILFAALIGRMIYEPYENKKKERNDRRLKYKEENEDEKDDVEEAKKKENEIA